MAEYDRNILPLHIGGYLADSMALSAPDHGSRLLLLMHFWQHGGLPDDPAALADIAKVSKRKWKRVGPLIMEMFDRKAWTVRKLEKYMHDDGRLPPDEWNELRLTIFDRDDYTCAYCGQRGGELHCDHVMPISRGGSNLPWNLVTACGPCNRSKGAFTPEEWRGRA